LPFTCSAFLLTAPSVGRAPVDPRHQYLRPPHMLPDGSDSGRSAKARRATRLSVIFRERRSASYPAIPKGIGRSRCPRPIGNTEPAAVWPDSGLVDVDKTGELAPCRLHRLAVCWQSPSRQGGRYPPQSGSSPRLCHPHLNDILVAAKQLNPLVYNTVVLDSLVFWRAGACLLHDAA
jgi:hypothetical protein